MTPRIAVAALVATAALVSLAGAAPRGKTPELTPYDACPPSLAPTPSGAIDRSFAVCGVRVTRAADSTAAAPVHYDATDLAILPDDRIVVVGRRMNQNGNSSDTLVLRYTANGALDATFGAGGVAVVNASGSGFGFESARGVLLQADGAVVVVGTSSNETVEGTKGYILRLTSAGALDATFGASGVTQIPATKEATGVVGDGAGGFYVSGKACAPACTAQLVHVLANGALDVSFGSGGALALSYAGGAETAQAIATAPGAVAVAGLTAFSIAWGDLGAARYTLGPPAALDPAFSGDGKLTHTLGAKGAVGDATLGNDLVMHVGGSREMGSPAAARFALTRIGASGAATTTTSVFPSSMESAIDALVGTPSRVYAAGHVRKTGGAYRMALAAYTSAGALDATFSGDGMADYNLTGDTRATAVGVQASGAVILAGRRLQSGASPGAIVLVRVKS